MLIGGLYLPISLLIERKNELTIFLISTFLGICLKLLIGPKGLGMPLGHGLTMTIDKAPSVGISLSEYVVSFHVDRNFVKKRQQVTDLIAESVNLLKATGNTYDVVLKSWIFGSRGPSTETRVKYFRRSLYIVLPTLLAFLAALLVACALGYCAKQSGDTQLIESCIRLVVVGMVVTPIVITLLLIFAKNMIKVASKNQLGNNPDTAARVLARSLINKTHVHCGQFISPRPIPKFYLLSMSIITPQVIKACGGDEAGFVLVHNCRCLDPIQ